MKEILVVEDDIDIQDILVNYLIDAGYDVTIASDGVEAITKFNENISLVLLDIMLPKIDGFGVCEVIRQKSNVPILMLTALSDEESQLRAFEYKIDDFISKPFYPRILLCKVDAVLRRRTTEEVKNNMIVYKDLCMDITGFHLFVRKQEIVLTQKEFEVLRILLENQGRVFTRQMLIKQIWDESDYVEDRIVDSHIKNLRKKLRVDYIETVRGVGYRIDKNN